MSKRRELESDKRLYGLRCMSEMELMKYKITNNSENALLASDIEVSLMLPFCVFGLETEDIPPLVQTASLLKHYKIGKTL